ncbi:DUF11 domain-containing protein [Nocardioides daphniae]|uniref:DUF11 domain-containing protein n=1 Tax=Nocardioides daphniae TaxID=402297 RepID=A0A4P7UAY5_9ACTN|nr:DUF11 domain-containing protein [Nocardioides daphniae]QCC77292.1 hypothetical protein E2C04_09010 [Nocardioides daphniae]GGD25665.1 hypothetical protein GCM10007231_26270 [Nocardioides daphniae]
MSVTLRRPAVWVSVVATSLVVGTLTVLAAGQVAPGPALAATPTPPEPGTLTRFVSWGTAVDALGDHHAGFYTADLDGTDVAPLVRQRALTSAESAADAPLPDIQRAQVSPDGLHVVAWVDDPTGLVVPGGTPRAEHGHAAPFSQALVLLDAEGHFVRVLQQNEEWEASGLFDVFQGVSWVDADRVAITVRRKVLVGTEAETTRTFVRTVAIADGSVVGQFGIDDGTVAGGHVQGVWAGGGTVVAGGPSNRSLVLFRPGEGAVGLPAPPLTPPMDFFDGYSDVAVSPDGLHVAASYHGGWEVGTKLRIFDRVAGGVWQARAVDLPIRLESGWITWLPYRQYEEAELLVDGRRDSQTLSLGTAVRVAPGVATEERVARQYPWMDYGSDSWQAVVVPSLGAGASDVALELPERTATAGTPWVGTYTLTGRGPDTARGVQLSLEIDGAPAEGASVEGEPCPGGVCHIASLAPGQTVTLTLRQSFEASGVHSLVARTTSTTLDWNPGNNLRTNKIRVVMPRTTPSVGRLVHQTRAGGPVVVSDPDGGRPVVVGQPRHADEVLEITDVHPGAGIVLWSRHRTSGGDLEHLVSRVTGEQLHAVTTGFPLDAAVSPDGRTLFTVEATDQDRVFRLAERRLDRPAAPPTTRLTWRGSLAKGLKVSPDGTRLAWVQQPIGEYSYGGAVMDLDFRGEAELLVTGSFGAVRPNTTVAWAPDSATVALSVGTEGPYSPDGAVVAFSVDDVGSPRALAPMDEDRWLGDWSPDGKSLLLHDLSTSLSVDLATGRATPTGLGPAWWSGLPVGPVSPSPSPTVSPTVSPSPTPSPTASPTPTTGPSPTSSTSPTGSPTASPAPAPDRTAPKLDVLLPKCGSRKGKKCRDHLRSPAAWATVNGVASDSDSGVAGVSLRAVQKRGKHWYAFNGRGWSRQKTRAAAESRAKALPATLKGTRWAVKLKGLRAGTLVLNAVAHDRSGNRATKVLTRTLS